MMALRVLGTAMWVTGLAATLFGLWCVAGGLRVVVSGRVDERKQSGGAARFGVPFVVVGALLLFGGIWLANWAAGS